MLQPPGRHPVEGEQELPEPLVHGIDEAELSAPGFPGGSRRVLGDAEHRKDPRISCMVVRGDP